MPPRRSQGWSHDTPRWSPTCPGVSAYLGAAPSLFAEKELLAAAASIYGIEARHAAIVGVLLDEPAEGGVHVGATEKPTSRE